MDDLKQYAEIIKEQYKTQPIVATDWPLRIGKDFFRRLSLIEPQDYFEQDEMAWCMLRGKVDEITIIHGCKKLLLKISSSLHHLSE